MKNVVYDYAIIGGGMAGIQLANALVENELLEPKKLLIIESNPKNQNDKTWCFWEKGNGKWDEIVSYHWNKAEFIQGDQFLNFDLKPYSYKRVRSIDFYEKYIPQLKGNPNISWVEDKVEKVQKGEQNLIQGEKEQYTSLVVFDSRVEIDLKSIDYPAVLQHFKGWVIQTKEKRFKPGIFTMMDYRIGHNEDCCFTYILPTSETEALIEFTFFSPELVEDSTYDNLIKAYIELIGIKEYTIKETEGGVIPMTAYPFWEDNAKNFLKIGTAGGWVKASSGYSFKNAEKKVAQIISNLKEQKPLAHNISKGRHHWYDSLFLDVLAKENHLGNRLFGQMYRKNSIQTIFSFLDEETNFFQEIQIMNSFNKAPFLRGLRRKYLS